MIVLKASNEQYIKVNGVVSERNTVVKFIKDINDNWITSINCRDDKTYSDEICLILFELEEIKHEPKPVII